MPLQLYSGCVGAATGLRVGSEEGLDSRKLSMEKEEMYCIKVMKMP